MVVQGSPHLWREIQRENFTDWQQLADHLELDDEKRSSVLKRSRFPLNMPRRLAGKVAKNCLNDPILRQFLPLVLEEQETAGFSADPVGDALARKQAKLLCKYPGRALLTVTSACAMNCRFCFRQNFDYQVGSNFADELASLSADPSIHEIILSGGDPLSLGNQALSELIDRLEQIPHLKRLRFHTRFPIGIPERVDEGLLDLLRRSRFQIWMVIHTNHFAELDAEVLTALKAIQKLGIPVLSQTVLLRGVNDRIETLKTLCKRLVDHGVTPYYLHQLDRVKGAAHFEVSEDEGRSLIAQLTEELSGYAVPKYVREIQGEKSKTSLLHP